ncbi:hypothetical protein ABZ815_16120 [Nonomuraea sp. NPDC047529]|uniref:hypothetical protein n=1 Tax=Nonomuraea sp. NPDC047529 TaxID=3155623 RepID=UPI0033C94BD4
MLVVASPYGTWARLLVEAEVGRRGWPVAASPAEASLVVVCGRPGPELAGAVRGVWGAVPVPRALVGLPPDVSGGEVVAALDGAVRVLGDERGQWADARDMASGSSGDGAGEPPMAERGADRDGLKLDRLHVPLGPVLVDWPAGLVVETVLQGDVIQEAQVRALSAEGAGSAFWEAGPGERREETRRRTAAARLDSLGRLLGVAGWPAAAREARRLRDRLLAGAVDAGDRRRCVRFTRRVRRSWVLRWMLRGAGQIGPDAPRQLQGDALDRLHRWLDEIEAMVGVAEPGEVGERDGGSRVVREWGGREGSVGAFGGGRGSVGEVLALLPGLLVGAELAVARLIVAGLDPDLDRLSTGAEAGTRDG